ncbi:MAG: hypothetical protein NNC43_03275 [Candidatus Granulicatella sp. P6S_S16_bin.50.1]|nr:hypothetical protein [Candidatus Granulicatella sp. P6S_S16_bin.50.1]
MFLYLKNLREEYTQTKNSGEGFLLWLIKRKANDGVRQVIAYSLFFFSVYLWTDLRLGIFIIEIGSILYILTCIAEFLFREKMKSKEVDL